MLCSGPAATAAAATRDERSMINRGKAIVLTYLSLQLPPAAVVFSIYNLWNNVSIIVESSMFCMQTAASAYDRIIMVRKQTIDAGSWPAV